MTLKQQASSSPEALTPPMLSPYALSILDHKPGTSSTTKTTMNSNTNTATTKFTATRQYHPLQSSSQPTSQSQNTTAHTSVLKHSMFMQKLGLGAPRRLSGQPESSVESNNHVTTTKLNNITNTNTRISSTKQSNFTNTNTLKTSNTNTNSNSNASSTLMNRKERTFSNTQPTSVENNTGEKKHILQLTPKKHSPLHKRTNIVLAPSPELGRRGIVPQIKSQLKLPSVSNGDIFSDTNALDLNHVQSIIDKKKEIALLKKEIAQYKQQLIDQRGKDEQGKELRINERVYTLHEQIGKGGSSIVYKGKSINGDSNKFVAVKIVNLNDHESTTIDELKGEIKILHKLRHSSRVVKLLDYSITKQNLYFVMECGDLDLATVLSTRHSLENYYDIEFIRYHCNEMIKCIKAIHQLEIVHLDLKPANFVFVSGILKLIDFGISNTIQSHTVNIYREFQMGTPNYMAPETLIDDGNVDNERQSIWKVGKPADIWSLGCIIYQLTYGVTPYASYTGTKKILAITNPRVNINYPTTAINLRRKDDTSEVRVCMYLQDMIRRCLIRDPRERIDINGLSEHNFINPVIIDRNVLNEVVRGCVGFGGRHVELKDVALGKINDSNKEARLNRLVDGVWKRVSNE